MTHDVRIWFVPLVAIGLGLLLFLTSKDRWSAIGGYVFLCGFFIVLWLLTFGPVPIR